MPISPTPPPFPPAPGSGESRPHEQLPEAVRHRFSSTASNEDPVGLPAAAKAPGKACLDRRSLLLLCLLDHHATCAEKVTIDDVPLGAPN